MTNPIHRRETEMKPVKTALQPIRKGLEVLTKGIKDMQKLLDNIEDALASEKTKKITKAKATRAKKRPAGKSTAKKRPSKKTATDTILTIIKASPRGVTSAQIKEKTGFSDMKMRNVIFRLKKQGKIRSRKRGVYIKV